jgi:transcriptional regulator of nitric oxide reductase
MRIDPISRLVVPESALVNNSRLDAVAVSRGIAVNLVSNAPSVPAVSNRTVFVGASEVILPAAAVATAVAFLGVCANGAVKVFIIYPP